MKNRNEITICIEKKTETLSKILDTFTSLFPFFFDHSCSNEEYAEKIVSKGYFLSAYKGEECVGLLAFYANDIDTKLAYVSLLAIKETIGLTRGIVLRKLLSFAARISLDNGMERVKLEVLKNNELAKKIYCKMGFTYLNEATAYSDYYICDIKTIMKVMRLD